MDGLTRYTLKEIARRDGKNGADTWIVIKDVVYDVTNYKIKHPGGAEVMEEYAGQDATRAFEDFGHSSDARRIMKQYIVGVCDEEDRMANGRKKDVTFHEASVKDRSGRRRFLAVLCGKCAA